MATPLASTGDPPGTVAAATALFAAAALATAAAIARRTRTGRDDQRLKRKSAYSRNSV